MLAAGFMPAWSSAALVVTNFSGNQQVEALLSVVEVMP
jgi:hypothetical protein